MSADITYNLVRSHRRSIALCIRPNGELEVRCPWNTSTSKIDEFVRAKQSWITKKSQLQKEHCAQKEQFQLHIGDKVRFLGERYPIASSHDEEPLQALVGRRKKAICFDGDRFLLPSTYDSQQLKDAVVLLYRRLAQTYIPEQVRQYALLYHFSPKKIRITGASTRWGSCSGKNNLSFSWKLMMSDRDCVKYVILHELAHTKEHNHSEQFWAIVEKMMPDYSDAEKRLKQLGRELLSENWDQ